MTMTTNHFILFMLLAMLITTVFCFEVLGNKQYKEVYPMWKRQMREPLRFGKRLASDTDYFKYEENAGNRLTYDNYKSRISFQNY
ncbi:hypothetical protein ACQ4LE_009217 [Meloidogyne hapla]